LYKFVLDIFFEIPFEQPDINIVIIVEIQDNLLKFGSIDTGRTGLSDLFKIFFCSILYIDISKNLFKFLFKDCIEDKNFFCSIALVIRGFLVEFTNIEFEPVENLSI